MAVPVQRWIEQQGFSSNPFEFFEADRETTLSEYFVRAEWFDALRGDPKNPTSGVLFAPRGYGKSSHRLEIARICAADKRHPALIVEVTDYTWLLAGGLEQVTSTRYLQYIVGQALRRIWDTFVKFPARWAALADDARRVLDFHGLASWANEGLPPYWLPPPTFSHVDQQALARRFRLDPTHPMLSDQLVEAMVRQYQGTRQEEALRDTARFATDAGFAYIQVLVDRVDEHELTEHDSSAAVRLIKPLISNLNIIEFRGIAFKFFLPDDMRAALKDMRVSRAGERLSAYELHWSHAELQELLARRLEHYSKSARSSSSLIHQFQDLCESGANADTRMVAAARSSPRQLIQLGRKLITVHCQVARDFDEKISALTLAAVLGDAPPAEHVDMIPADLVGMPDRIPLLYLDDAGFIWLGDKKQEINLTPTSRRLLQLLWQSKPTMLTTDQILDSLYTHQQGADALAKAVKRLRTQLEPGLANSKHYIDRVEGTGYRLVNYAEQKKN